MSLDLQKKILKEEKSVPYYMLKRNIVTIVYVIEYTVVSEGTRNKAKVYDNSSVSELDTFDVFTDELYNNKEDLLASL